MKFLNNILLEIESKASIKSHKVNYSCIFLIKAIQNLSNIILTLTLYLYQLELKVIAWSKVVITFGRF